MTWCAFFRRYSHLFSYMLQIYLLIRSTSQPRGVRVSGGSRAYKSSSGIFDAGETVSEGREPLNVWNLQIRSTYTLHFNNKCSLQGCSRNLHCSLCATFLNWKSFKKSLNNNWYLTNHTIQSQRHYFTYIYKKNKISYFFKEWHSSHLRRSNWWKNQVQWFTDQVWDLRAETHVILWRWIHIPPIKFYWRKIHAFIQ